MPAGRSRVAKLPRIVWISASTPNDALTTRSTRLATASTTLYYVEERTITIHVRWGAGWLDERVERAAAEVVQSKLCRRLQRGCSVRVWGLTSWGREPSSGGAGAEAVNVD